MEGPRGEDDWLRSMDMLLGGGQPALCLSFRWRPSGSSGDIDDTGNRPTLEEGYATVCRESWVCPERGLYDHADSWSELSEEEPASDVSARSASLT